MKAKNLNSHEKLIEIYCLNYVLKYLRCIVVQAQIEQVVLNKKLGRKVFISNKLLNLNLKHNKLVKNLFDQKQKIVHCA